MQCIYSARPGKHKVRFKIFKNNRTLQRSRPPLTSDCALTAVLKTTNPPVLDLPLTNAPPPQTCCNARGTTAPRVIVTCASPGVPNILVARSVRRICGVGQRATVALVPPPAAIPTSAIAAATCCRIAVTSGGRCKCRRGQE